MFINIFRKRNMNILINNLDLVKKTKCVLECR